MDLKDLETKRLKVIKVLYFCRKLYYVIEDRYNHNYLLVFFGHEKLDLENLELSLDSYSNMGDSEIENLIRDVNDWTGDYISQENDLPIAKEIFKIAFEDLKMLPSIAMDIEDCLVDIGNDNFIIPVYNFNDVMEKLYNAKETNDPNSIDDLKNKNLTVALHGITVGNNLKIEHDIDAKEYLDCKYVNQYFLEDESVVYENIDNGEISYDIIPKELDDANGYYSGPVVVKIDMLDKEFEEKIKNIDKDPYINVLMDNVYKLK